MAFFCPEIDFYVFKLRRRCPRKTGHRDSLKTRGNETAPQIEIRNTTRATQKSEQNRSSPISVIAFAIRIPGTPHHSLRAKILHNKYNFMFHIAYRRVHTFRFGPFMPGFCVSIFATSAKWLAPLATLHRTAEPITKDETEKNME